MKMNGWRSYLVFSALCVLLGVIAGSWAVFAGGYPWYGFIVVGAVASVGAWCSCAVAFLGIGAIRTIRERDV